MEKKNGSHRSCRQKKAEWLQANSELWKNKINPFKPKEHLPEITELAKAVQAAGLYSAKTLLCDIRSGLIKMLQDQRFTN